MSETQSETANIVENSIDDSNNFNVKNKGNTVADDNGVIGSSGTNRKGGKKSGSLSSFTDGAIASSKVI